MKTLTIIFDSTQAEALNDLLIDLSVSCSDDPLNLLADEMESIDFSNLPDAGTTIDLTCSLLYQNFSN